VGTVEVIVMKIVRKEASSVVAGVIGAGIGPLASNCLDEAFGLAIGLRAIRTGEAVFDAELLASGGEEPGAISGAAIGEQALDGDAVVLVEGDGLAQSVEGTGDLFVGVETGESEAGVVVDGDVEAFDAGAWIALGAVAGGADAWACEAAQLLDVEVKEIAGRVAFVADDGRFWRLQGSQSLEAVAAQDAGEGGLGDGQDHLNLSVRTTLAAQGQDLGFKLGGSLAWLEQRSRRTVVEAQGKALLFGASEPAADGLFANAESGCCGPQGEAELVVPESHLGSRQRGKFGISVHVVRAGRRWVECSSTTSLPDPFRADNLLKHDI